VKLEIYETEPTLAHALASSVASSIHDHPDLVLGLPTGRTPIALYRELVALTPVRQIDWSRVRTFNLDEFVGLGDNAPGSYRRFMQQHLFQHVNVRPEHIGFLDGRSANLDAECERYERAIRQAGGIDLMILGIGSNGHIGFNEPCDVLPARTHRVTLEEPSRAANALWFGGDIRAVPREALSMGMATILNAREVVLMATGEGKADAVREMIAGDITTELPASFLQLHPHVTVTLDEDAASGLGPQTAQTAQRR
jgi:glucosamine-6-phosphate deaminase